MFSDFFASFSWSDFLLIAIIGYFVWALGVYVDARWRHAKTQSSGTDTSPPTKKVWSVTEQQEAAQPPATSLHPAANHLPYMPRPAANQLSEQQEGAAEEQDEEQADTDDDTDYDTLENIALDISEVATTLGTETTDQIVLSSIREALAKYPPVSKLDHRDAINRLVLRCVKQDCGITLSQGQIDSIWDQAQA